MLQNRNGIGKSLEFLKMRQKNDGEWGDGWMSGMMNKAIMLH